MPDPDDATHSRRAQLLQTVHFRPRKRRAFCAHDTACVQDTDRKAWAVTELMSAVENKKNKKLVELFFIATVAMQQQLSGECLPCRLLPLMHLRSLTVLRCLVKNSHLPSFFFVVFTLYRNVFKRLKFLGNKKVSHFSTLLFLTLWHGFHSGYFMCFAMEFIIITVEKQVGAQLLIIIAHTMGSFARAIDQLCFRASVLLGLSL